MNRWRPFQGYSYDIIDFIPMIGKGKGGVNTAVVKLNAPAQCRFGTCPQMTNTFWVVPAACWMEVVWFGSLVILVVEYR